MFKHGWSNEVLHEARIAKSLPLEALAAQAFISVSTLTKWEKWGVAPASDAIKERISILLGVPVADLEKMKRVSE